MTEALVSSWWASVTPQEIADSANLLAGLMEPARSAQAVDVAALSRAVVLQQLFCRDTLLVELLEEATVRTRAVLAEPGSDAEAADTWLQHCKFLTQVLGQAVQMLCAEESAKRRDWLDQLDREMTSLRRQLVRQAMAQGLSHPIKAMPPITFRKRPRG